jgi:hypothetical protein
MLLQQIGSCERVNIDRPSTCSDLEIPFWVKGADFDREYPPGSQARVKLEQQVTNDYR